MVEWVFTFAFFIHAGSVEGPSNLIYPTLITCVKAKKSRILPQI